MALISPEFYTGPALIVGDGNFSFSTCLAQSLVENVSTQIFATSLDTREQLETNPVAIQNLVKLSVFPYINVVHGVDATNLEATFKDNIFHKVIFNFPHTGGKVKISKCRELLEKFFISASKRIDRTRGVVCVSLCQGQGGIPQDHVQRDYGNTWQVVRQAAKAGLLLHKVHPFREEDYPGYTSSGFKGRLNQKFTANKGLTYIFIHGSLVQPTPDLQTLKQRIESLPHSYTSLFVKNTHPVTRISRKIEQFCLPRDIKAIGNEFDARDYDKEPGCLEGKMTSTSRMPCIEIVSLHRGVHQLIKEKQDFVMSGIEVDFSTPASAGFHPISHYSVISKSYNSRTDLEAVQSELDATVSELIRDLSNGLYKDLINREPSENISCERDDLNFSKCQLNLFKPADYERLRHRKRNILEWRPRRNDHYSDSSPACSLVNDAQGRYDYHGLSDESETNKGSICQLEKNYFAKENNAKLSDIFEEITMNKFYYDDRVILTHGLVKDKEFEHIAWVILIHLDYLAMMLCGISDIRMLWSNSPLFIQQFHSENEDLIPQFIPFSLYPPVYIHDITFRLTTDATESKFFQAVHDVAGNMVSDVYCRDRYIDERKHQVSYNYRLIYCRCDGPLAHIQTVEIQNKLRLLLLDLKFHLS